MGKQSQAWKDAERAIAEQLGGKRVVRADWGVSDTDVKVEDFPQLKIDSKYRGAWAHTSYLKEVADKYAKEPGDIPVLVTKQKRQQGAVVCLSLEDFGVMLNTIRDLRRRAGIDTPAQVGDGADSPMISCLDTDTPAATAVQAIGLDGKGARIGAQRSLTTPGSNLLPFSGGFHDPGSEPNP